MVLIMWCYKLFEKWYKIDILFYLVIWTDKFYYKYDYIWYRLLFINIMSFNILKGKSIYYNYNFVLLIKNCLLEII